LDAARLVFGKPAFAIRRHRLASIFEVQFLTKQYLKLEPPLKRARPLKSQDKLLKPLEE
jgi:hypothetical protein